MNTNVDKINQIELGYFFHGNFKCLITSFVFSCHKETKEGYFKRLKTKEKPKMKKKISLIFLWTKIDCHFN